MLHRLHSAPAPRAAPPSGLPAPAEADPLDAVLLAGYDPALSAAWAGAAPPLWTAPATQLDLWAGIAQAIVATEEREGSPFRARGFIVRPVAGPGAARILDEFCTRTHRTLTGRGMNGRAYGLYDPEGHLVGVANFAPPSNHRTAEGMQVPAPGDRHLPPRARAQVTFSQRELLDCVRLCVAEETASGIPLGTGAESFLYAACLRVFLDENRTLWRAIRMAELGLPLPRAHARLLARGASFVRVVRSFAETAVGVGSPYAATGAWYLGTTRAETVWVGRRSGEAITRRSLAKMRGAGDGHVHQVLRAAWDGSAGAASRPPGRTRWPRRSAGSSGPTRPGTSPGRPLRSTATPPSWRIVPSTYWSWRAAAGTCAPRSSRRRRRGTPTPPAGPGGSATAGPARPRPCAVPGTRAAPPFRGIRRIAVNPEAGGLPCGGRDAPAPRGTCRGVGEDRWAAGACAQRSPKRENSG